MRQRTKPFLKSEPLDLIMAANRGRLYPLIFCHISLNGQIEVLRLKGAVSRAGKIIPELFCAYDFDHARFLSKGFTTEHLVVMKNDCAGEYRWDLSTGPQLRVTIDRKENGCDDIIVGISHILTDAQGFLQILYLLSALYNGEKLPDDLQNRRDVSPVLRAVRTGKATVLEKRAKNTRQRPFSFDGEKGSCGCLCCRIESDKMKKIDKKAKEYGATLNDVFLTAYARTAVKLLKTDAVIIPCPADLRRYSPVSGSLTAANMTGRFQLFIEVKQNHPFEETLKKVHEEMRLQKARFRCFQGIKPLFSLYGKLPYPLLYRIIRQSYGNLPVSYTNIGVIDSGRLCFENCEVLSCFLTGSYRQPPDFQLTVSTFRGACMFNCTLTGSEKRLHTGKQILKLVKRELTDWTE